METLHGQVDPPNIGEAENPIGGRLAGRMATVFEVDPVNYRYTLKDDGDNLIEDAVPIGDSGGTRGEGDIRIYDVDTRVVVIDMEIGRRFFIPVDSSNADPTPYEIDDAENVTDTGMSLPMSTEDTDISHTGTRPRDLQEGDRVLRGPLGNAIAILSNGLSILRGSRTAEIMASALDGTVQVISNRFRHYVPAWGKISIGQNNSGGASLIIRANGSREFRGDGNHKIDIEVGAPGVRVEVRTPDGQPAGFIHIDNNGGINMSAKPSVITQESREARQIVSGDFVLRVDGKTTELLGNRSQKMSSTKRETAGTDEITANDLLLAGNNQMGLSAGRMTDNVSYNGLTPTTPRDSVRSQITSGGSASHVVGNDLDAKAFPSYVCNVKNGNATFAVGTTSSGRFQVLTAKPATVPMMIPGFKGIEGSLADPNANLDITPGIYLGKPGPLYPPVKWDPSWIEFITSLIIAIDSHTHFHLAPLIPAPGMGVTLPALATAPSLPVLLSTLGHPAKIQTAQTTAVGVMVN